MAGLEREKTELLVVPSAEDPVERSALSGYFDTWHRTDVWPDSVQVLDETLSPSGCPPRFGWLSFGLRTRRTPCDERLRGVCSARSCGALLAERHRFQARE
jgi:hypothetical protein